MRFLSGRWLMLAALTVLAALLISCGGDDDDSNDQDEGGGIISVALTEFAIAPNEDHARAGAVTFEATNEGEAPHELLVVRTDLAPDALPVTEGLVSESQIEIIGRVQQILAGESKTLTVSLEAGSYVLICNIPAHYGLGMTVAFTVE